MTGCSTMEIARAQRAAQAIQKLPGVIGCSAKVRGDQEIHVDAVDPSYRDFLDNLLEDEIAGFPVHVTTDAVNFFHWKPDVSHYQRAIESLPGVASASYDGSLETATSPPHGQLEIRVQDPELQAFVDALVSDRLAGVPTETSPSGAEIQVYYTADGAAY